MLDTEKYNLLRSATHGDVGRIPPSSLLTLISYLVDFYKRIRVTRAGYRAGGGGAAICFVTHRTFIWENVDLFFKSEFRISIFFFEYFYSDVQVVRGIAAVAGLVDR